jgi:hypothetical protein
VPRSDGQPVPVRLLETPSPGFTIDPAWFSGSAERGAGDGVDVVVGGIAYDGGPYRLGVDADQVEESGAAAQVFYGPGSALRWLAGRNQPSLLPRWMRTRSG